MRKLLVVLAVVVPLSLHAGLQEDLNKAILSSLGEAVAKVAEEVTSVPASSLGKIAGYFSAGDFKDAFLELSNLATDQLISALPVVGPAKFILELGGSILNTLKLYYDAKLVEAAWNVFQSLSDYDKKLWLEGDLGVEAEFIEALKTHLGFSYYYYIERNAEGILKTDLRQAFKKYWEEEKKAKEYMEYIAKITSLIEDAKYLIEPELYDPPDGSTIRTTTKIEMWRRGNNYFKLTLYMPDGSSYTKKIKVPDEESSVTVSFKLTDFEGVDWNSYFSKYPDGFDVTIRVDAAIYDSTGLIEKIMGPEFVTPKEKIIWNIPGQEKPVVHTSFSFKVVPNKLTKSFTISGTLYYDYEVVGYTSGSESDSFSLSMNLECDLNTGKAKAVDEDGDVWTGSCVGDGDIRSAKLSLGLQGLTAYLNIDFTSSSASLSSSGAISWSYCDTLDDETVCYTFRFTNVRGYFSVF